MMNFIRRPDWRNQYPCWRTWHTVILYLFAAGITALGCFSVWRGYQLVPDRPSPRHVVGLPFVALGVGLILRIRPVIRLTVCLCVGFLAFVALFIVSPFTPGGSKPEAIVWLLPPILFAFPMIKAMRQSRQ